MKIYPIVQPRMHEYTYTVREQTASNLKGSEDSRGKLTCFSDWLFRHHSGFQTNRTWKINSS